MPNYEWTLLLDPALEEEHARQQLSSLASIVQEEGGIVQSQEILGRRALAHTLQKRQEAYLGRIEGILAQDRVESVGKKLQGIPSLMRFMLTLKPKAQSVSQLRRFSRPTLRPAELPREKMDVQEIDKKIEELLQEPKA